MNSSTACRAAICCAFFAGLVFSLVASAHKDDYLGDTFVFVTLDRGEAEPEYWIDWRSDPRGLLHTAGLEYGVTDRFMLDISARFAQPFSGADHFETEFTELRCRFGDEGGAVAVKGITVSGVLTANPTTMVISRDQYRDAANASSSGEC
jgi:hypothetical protein